MVGSSDFQQNKLGFRFSTQSYWITGWITAIHHRLLDMLNNEHVQTLICENVVVRRHGDQQAEYHWSADYANVGVSTILFATPMDERRDPARSPLTWVKKRPERVFMAIEPYEITGAIHLGEEYRLADVLQAVRDRFIAITDATVRKADDADFIETHEVLFANRQHVDFILPLPAVRSEDS